MTTNICDHNQKDPLRDEMIGILHKLNKYIRKEIKNDSDIIEFDKKISKFSKNIYSDLFGQTSIGKENKKKLNCNRK